MATGIKTALNGVFDHMRWQESTGKVEEVVGLILDRGHILRLTNQAHSAQRFDIGPTQFEEAVMGLRRDRAILAFYHSHPVGGLDLSLEDQTSLGLHFSHGVTLPWLIVTDTPTSTARLHWVDPSYLTFASYDLAVEGKLVWQT